MPIGQESPAYQRALRELIKQSPDKIRIFEEPGQTVLYRPGEVLCHKDDRNRVQAALAAEGHSPVGGPNITEDVVRFKVDASKDIVRIVRDLRNPDRWDNKPPPLVQPHHVLLGTPNMMGGPIGPPEPVTGMPGPGQGRGGEGAGLTIGICDTGISATAATTHPQWLGGWYTLESDDVDPLYTGGGDLLGLQGGHGTFVAGVARQAAPGVRIDPEKALEANGIGDEEALAIAIGKLKNKCDILNLSLGCFTLDDQKPLPVQSMINSVPPNVVITASAGNLGNDRKCWPAAFDRVIGVAALAGTPTGWTGAGYSNRGGWVDACALADRVSTYVSGRLRISGEPDRTYRNFARWAGTSFAAPYVAGRIAATATKNNISPHEAAAKLLDPGDPLDPGNPSRRFGDFGVPVS